MKKILGRLGCIVLILICLVALFPAYLFMMEMEDESQGQIFSDYYIFNPGTVFTEYTTGKQDLFSVILLDDLTDDVLNNLPVYPPANWIQKDYLDLLNIFQENTFHGSFPKRIREARFSIQDCSQVSYGPQEAVFFTADINPGRVTNYSYSVSFKDGSVHYHGNVYDPIISWPVSFLDLSKYGITAEKALQIAEGQGGEKVRLVNHNQCETM
jgi:hypothetical protein